MYTYRARCVKVVDGDTMDFDVDLGFHLTNRIRVRLKDIDTPEIYGKTTPEEKKFGLEVKQFVVEQLFELDISGFNYNHKKEVIIKTEKTGSFGRWLADVIFDDGTTLAERIRKEFPEVR